MSICGQEKMFLIRVKSNRYNVNLIQKINKNNYYFIQNHDRLQFTCVAIESIDPRLMCRLYLEDIGRMCRILLNQRFFC